MSREAVRDGTTAFVGHMSAPDGTSLVDVSDPSAPAIVKPLPERIFRVSGYASHQSSSAAVAFASSFVLPVILDEILRRLARTGIRGLSLVKDDLELRYQDLLQSVLEQAS